MTQVTDTKKTIKAMWEPCVSAKTRVTLPVSLSQLEDLSPILNMDTFNLLLNDAERESLKALLPKEDDKTQHETLEQLFGGENFFFGNPVAQFQANLQAGMYHASVVKYRAKVAALRKQKQFHDEHQYKSNLLQKILVYKQSAGLIGLGSYEESLIEPTMHAPPAQQKRKAEKKVKVAEEDEDLEDMEVDIEVVEEEVEEEETEGKDIDMKQAGPEREAEPATVVPIVEEVEDMDKEEAESDDVDVVEEEGEEELGGASDTESSGSESSSSSPSSRRRVRSADDKKRSLPDGTGDEERPSKRKRDKKRNSSRKKEVVKPKKVPIIFVLFSKIKAAFSGFNYAATAETIVNKLEESGEIQELILPQFTLAEFVETALKYLEAPPPLAPPAFIGPVPPTASTKVSEPLVKFDKTKKLWRWIDHHSSRTQMQSFEQLFYFAASRDQLDRKTGQIKVNVAKQQKCTITMPPSTVEMVARFREQEADRYKNPSKPFTYTSSGLRTVVAPMRRSNPSTKPREHFLLKTGRPPHINLLCLVRDAASRLPGGVGTRPDVALLLRDSQWIVEEVGDAQLNTVVSGALDRLHSQKDPCVRFDPDQKLWIYLHRQRKEHEFAPVASKQRARKIPPEDNNINNNSNPNNISDSIAQPSSPLPLLPPPQTSVLPPLSSLPLPPPASLDQFPHPVLPNPFLQPLASLGPAPSWLPDTPSPFPVLLPYQNGQASV